MYVRDCYVYIANKLLGEGENSQEPPLNSALLLGPRGVGKTMFLNYLIIRIVEKERTLSSTSIVYLCGCWNEGIRFTISGIRIRIDTGHADYFLSDSIDVNDGSLGQKFLIEVAPEFYGKFNKFKLRMRERNGS